MSKKAITEKQFNQVTRLTTANTPIDKIASNVGITESSIRSIRQAGTYEEYSRRRELKARRASADRAMHPEPRPQNPPVKKAEAKKSVATTWGQAAKDLKRTKSPRVRGVTRPQGQAKHGVTEEPISAHVLQDAYTDAIKRNDELAESLKRNSDILSETLGELRLIRHRFEREDREQTIRESRERQQKKIFGFRIHRS